MRPDSQRRWVRIEGEGIRRHSVSSGGRERSGAGAGFATHFLLPSNDAEAQAELLDELGFPFAIYGTYDQTHPEWLQVDYDHVAMMAMAVQTLAEHGKTRPAMLCSEGENDSNDQLVAGFKRACEDHYGAHANTDMVVRVRGDITTEWQVDEAFDHWMAMPQSQRPDSIVMGVETGALVCVEENIWRHGMLIGFAPNQFGLTGACFMARHWLRGEFATFDWLDGSAVARLLTEGIMLPLLRGKAVAEPIMKVVPPMFDCIGRSSKGLHYLAAVAAKSEMEKNNDE